MMLLERNGMNQLQINGLMRKSCNSIAYAQMLRLVRFKPRKENIRVKEMITDLIYVSGLLYPGMTVHHITLGLIVCIMHIKNTI